MKAALVFILQFVTLMSFSSTSSSSLPTDRLVEHIPSLSDTKNNPIIFTSFTASENSGNSDYRHKSMEPSIVVSSRMQEMDNLDLPKSVFPTNSHPPTLHLSSFDKNDASHHTTPPDQKSDFFQNSPKLVSIVPSSSNQQQTHSSHSQELKPSSPHWISSDSVLPAPQIDSGSIPLRSNPVISSSPVQSVSASTQTSSGASSDIYINGAELDEFLHQPSYTSESNSEEYALIEPSSVIALEKTDLNDVSIRNTPQLRITQNIISGNIVSPSTSLNINTMYLSSESKETSLQNDKMIHSSKTSLNSGDTGRFSDIATRLTKSDQISFDSTEVPQTQNPTLFTTSTMYNTTQNKSDNLTSSKVSNTYFSESTTASHLTGFNPNGSDATSMVPASNSTSKPVAPSTQYDFSSHKNPSQQSSTPTYNSTSPPQNVTSRVIATSPGNILNSTEKSNITSERPPLPSDITIPSTSTINPTSTTAKPALRDISPILQIFSSASSNLNQTQPTTEPNTPTTNYTSTTESVPSNITRFLNHTSMVQPSMGPSQVQNESQVKNMNATHNLVQPDTQNKTLNSSSGSLEQTPLHKSSCNCTSRLNTALELLLLRKLIPRVKTVKTFMSGIVIDDGDTADSQKSPTPRSADNAQAQSASGVVCYDDRMSIASAEVECPKLTSRKTSLEDHHLDQILKNEGKRSVHSFVSPANFQQINLGTVENKTNPEEQLLANVQSLLKEQLTFHQYLRQYITEYLTSSTTRNILSLTSFLKTHAAHSLQGNDSDLWNDLQMYLMCKLNGLDIGNITSFYDQLEREMLKSESQSKKTSSWEDSMETIFYYNYRSSILLRLKDNLQTSLQKLNSTFSIISRTLSRNESSLYHSKQYDSGVKTTGGEKSAPTSTQTDSGKLKHRKNDIDESVKQISSSRTRECVGLVSNLENRNSFAQGPDKTNLRQDYDVTSGKSFDSFGHYGLIVSELFDSIFSMLNNFKTPETSTNLSFSFLRNIGDRSASLRKEVLEYTHNKRTKRSVIGSSDDVCYDQGSRIPNTDFHLMCSTCVNTTVLDANYFPRHITEKTCKNAAASTMAQSGSVPIQNGCLNEGGRAGGLCQQQTMTILLLHRNVGKCMKVISRGQEFITDQWKLATYKLRTGCECVVDKNSQFVKYLTFG